MKYVIVSEILEFLEKRDIKFEYVGDRKRQINGFSSLGNYVEGTVTWVKSAQNIDSDIRKEYSLCIVEKGVVFCADAKIICEKSKAVFFSIIEEFFLEEEKKEKIGKNTVLGDKVIIGKDVFIGANCSIQGETTIGDGTIIEDNVVIRNKVSIGKNCIIHSGATIGTDGFGYYVDENGEPQKVIHFGGVDIADNVEVGANTCIDRGTIDNTYIGANSKIDNLVHIAHNAQIGNSVMVVAGAVVCGSVKLHDESYVAPGGIVKNQITVGKNAFVGMGAVVTKTVDDNTVVAGVPAKTLRNTSLSDK